MTYKMNKIIFVYALASVISISFAETCQKPEVIASAYVTEDATVLTNVAFTTQFVLKCSNGVKGISLYAEVEGKALPAVRLSADNKYQVTILHKIFSIITTRITYLINLEIVHILFIFMCIMCIIVGILDRRHQESKIW